MLNLVSYVNNNADDGLLEQKLPETMSRAPQMATGSTMANRGVIRMVCSIASRHTLPYLT
jgi:hypothetical protein